MKWWTIRNKRDKTNWIDDEFDQRRNDRKWERIIIESFNLKGSKMSAFIQQSFQQS